MILVTEEQKDDPDAIRCIGIDRKQHLYYALENTCLCGVSVLKKISDENDMNLYSCYECMY